MGRLIRSRWTLARRSEGKIQVSGCETWGTHQNQRGYEGGSLLCRGKFVVPLLGEAYDARVTGMTTDFGAVPDFGRDGLAGDGTEQR